MHLYELQKKNKTKIPLHFFSLPGLIALQHSMCNIYVWRQCASECMYVWEELLLFYFIGFYVTTGSGNPYGLHNTVQRKFLSNPFKAFARWLCRNVRKWHENAQSWDGKHSDQNSSHWPEHKFLTKTLKKDFTKKFWRDTLKRGKKCHPPVIKILSSLCFSREFQLVSEESKL